MIALTHMIMGFSNLETVDSAFVDFVTIYRLKQKIGLRLKDGTYMAVENATNADRAELARSNVHVYENNIAA